MHSAYIRILKQTCWKIALGAIAAGVLVIPGCGDKKTAEKIVVNDHTIEAAISKDLAVNPIIDERRIDLAVEEGIVTLSGVVGNLLASSQAVRIAESFRGVSAVVNMLSVEAPSRPDSEIEQDVIRAIAGDPATEAFEISVDVDSAKVRLTGTVDSWAEKTLCSKVVKSVKGVRAINNELLVNYEELRLSGEIKGEIERRFELDPYLAHETIDVEVMGDSVVLSGTVSSAAQKTRAHWEANVEGVNHVNTEKLAAASWDQPGLRRETEVVYRTDEEIKRAIEDALLYDPRVSLFEIDVEVEDWSVTLSGTVNTLRAKRAAEGDAKNTVGVTNVNNLITVGPAIEEEERDRLLEHYRSMALADPVVEFSEVAASFSDAGELVISGSVNSYYEKYRAEDLAMTIKGVPAVKNLITVQEKWVTEKDRNIENFTEMLISMEKEVEGGKLDVSVEEGIARLEGSVDSWYELKLAIDDAFDAGAWKVKTDVSIGDVFENKGEYDYWDRYYKISGKL
ncbi:MAG: BON domain-containing protein [Chitinivibrionales bacterium]|nr:BON domain-containing protein [Chitinivibrionales bacterium]